MPNWHIQKLNAEIEDSRFLGRVHFAPLINGAFSAPFHFMEFDPLGNVLFDAPPTNPRENISGSVNHDLNDNCQENHGGTMVTVSRGP